MMKTKKMKMKMILTVLWFSETLLPVRVRRRLGEPVDAVVDISTISIWKISEST